MNRVFQWFADSGHAAFVASLLSVVAFVFSMISYRKSQKTQHRLVEIEEAREKDRQMDRSKAVLTAHIKKEILTIKSRSVTQHYLVVENKGFGQARSIDLRVDGQSVHDHSCFSNVKEICFIGPQSSFRYLLILTMGGSIPSRVDITWQDDSGEKGEYRSALTL